MLATMAVGTCAPVNPQNTLEEVVEELLASRASVVIVPEGSSSSSVPEGLESTLAAAGLAVLAMAPNPHTAGLFTLRALARQEGGGANNAAKKVDGCRAAVGASAGTGTGGTVKRQAILGKLPNTVPLPLQKRNAWVLLVRRQFYFWVNASVNR